MRDNIFAEVYQTPYTMEEEWVPLVADNRNSPIGQDIPSLSARRRVRVATAFVTVHRGRPRRDVVIETPIVAERFEAAERVSLTGRVKEWFLSDPA